MGPPKVSPIWEYFKEDENDYSWAICQIPGCKLIRISRGKSGKPRSAMTTGVLDKHLLLHHPKKYHEFIEAKEQKNAKKRKESEEEENELQSGSLKNSDLRTNTERNKFLKQCTLQNWVREGTFSQSPNNIYKTADIRAKDRHRGILMMIVNDLQPFTIVNDPGFLYHSYTMHPHFKAHIHFNLLLFLAKKDVLFFSSHLK